MSKLNIELFKKLRNRFARMRHRKHFRITQIAVKTDCGAAMCFIGHTLQLQGYKMRLKPHAERTFRDPYDAAAAARSDYVFIRPNGKTVKHPVREAAKHLGILSDPKAVFQAYHVKTPKQAVKFLDHIIETGKVPEVGL
jgi:hypothetical protein